MVPHHRHHGEGSLLGRQEHLPAGTPGQANPKDHRVPHPGKEGLQLGICLGEGTNCPTLTKDYYYKS